MKMILVPTDFSKNALNAVKYACAYAEKTKSKVILFHSYVNPESGLDIPFTNIHFNKENSRIEAENKMVKLTFSLLKDFPKLRPKCIIQPGNASKNTIEYIRLNKIDIVIIGTTGQGAFATSIIGSTASDIIAGANCAIIVVPPKARYTDIVMVAHATGMKKENLSDMDGVVAFARQHKAELDIVYVQEFEILNAEDLLRKMVVRIKKYSRYKKINYYIRKDFSLVRGLNYFIKKNKPDVLTLVTDHIKFTETIWKTSWINEMAKHLFIPIFILHKHKQKPEAALSTGIGVTGNLERKYSNIIGS